jgi:hypothetical protein
MVRMFIELPIGGKRSKNTSNITETGKLISINAVNGC